MAAQVHSAPRFPPPFYPPDPNTALIHAPMPRPLYRDPNPGNWASQPRFRPEQVSLFLRPPFSQPPSNAEATSNLYASPEHSLRRKTPSGTYEGAYNGAFTEPDLSLAHVDKHVLRAPADADAPSSRPVVSAEKQARLQHKRRFVPPSEREPPKGLMLELVSSLAPSPPWLAESKAGALMPQVDSILSNNPNYGTPMDWQYSSDCNHRQALPLQAPVAPNGSADFAARASSWTMDQSAGAFQQAQQAQSAQQWQNGGQWASPNPASGQHATNFAAHSNVGAYGFNANAHAHAPPRQQHAQQHAQQHNPFAQMLKPREEPAAPNPHQYAHPQPLRQIPRTQILAATGQGLNNQALLTAPNTFALDYETPEQVLQKGYLVYRDLISAMQRARQHQSAASKMVKGPRVNPAALSFPQQFRQAQVGQPWPSATPAAWWNHAKPPLNIVAASHRNSQGLNSPVLDTVFQRWKSEADLRSAGYNVINALNKICEQGNSDWVEAMLLDGCVSYVLGEHDNAIRWYSRILEVDGNHVEASSNLAASYLAQNRRAEAEHYWRLAIRLRPHYFEAVEQLIQLLCADRRQKDAVDVIEGVQSILRSSSYNAYELMANGQHHESGRYGSPQKDNGRLMALIHVKGNILYNMQDQDAAAIAFAEVVLIAVGYKQGRIDSLIEAILRSLACFMPSEQKITDQTLILLPPDKALQTARLCFQPNGNLPGLDHIYEPQTRKSAISLASNSLLSLAKVFQDAMNPAMNQRMQYRSHHGVRNILALYYLSLSLQPSPSTANNVGILLASVQQAGKKTPHTGDGFMFPRVVPGSGVALALVYYKYGLDLDSKHAHLYTNLGSLLKDIGQLHTAVQMYERAVQCDSSFDIALANLANAVKDQGKVTEAIKYYRRAVEVNPKFSEAVCGLANALNSVCEWRGRGGVKLHGGAYDRWHVDDNNQYLDSGMNIHNTPGWISRVVEVVEGQLIEGRKWGMGILTDSYIEHIAHTLSNIGAVGRKRAEERKESLIKMISGWKGQKWEGARIVWFIERASKWVTWQRFVDEHYRGKKIADSAYVRPRLPAALTVPGAPTVLPFHTFTLPVDAKQVRLISQRNGLRVSTSILRAPWLPTLSYPAPRPPSPQIRVGYISSDFNNHPLAHLMQSVFGMHDKSRFTAYCYATTASDNSVHRHQIESEAPFFYDASSWSVERMVQQIVADGIHILVNLNGYTRGARNEIFAARPAPVQLSFMGFAGTLGAEWCDYLLADEMAVPPSSLRPGRRNVDLLDMAKHDSSTGDASWVYAENIIYTRSTFFCCDHRQSACPDPQQEQLMTWPDEQRRRWAMRKELFPQLADDAIIFGNFNQLYKIDPSTFRTWLRILSRVPNAYLWLLRFPADGQVNLQRTAAQWAGEQVASRLLFTDVAAKSVHIARGCIADLFLDTPECNAHTTAADCLWSGTPLLTLPRYPWKMCSRMAAGILGGALDHSTPEGQYAWSELVATNDDDYEERAVRLALGLRQPLPGSEGVGAEGRLVELRRLLWEGRWTCDLFDTRRWVRDLEAGFEVAWDRWVKGEGGDIYLRDVLRDE